MRWKVWQCQVCGWIYDESKGLPEAGIAPGTRWQDIPEDWWCPECQAPKSEFFMVEIGDAIAAPAAGRDADAAGPLVVVGAGLAGYGLVKELRKIDRQRPITLIAADSADHYPKPSISMALARGMTPDDLILSPADSMARALAIEVRRNTRVAAIDRGQRQIVLEDGARLPYGQLALALGSRPIRLAKLEGQDRVFHVNDLASYARFRSVLHPGAQVVIVGAGLIGCEMANDIVGAEMKACVVDSADRPLRSLVPAEVSAAIREGLERAGVAFRFGDEVERLDRGAGGVTIGLRSGAEMPAAAIVVAAGVAPKTDLAAMAGLAVGRGIVVDRFLRTADPDIFALGDCAEVDGLVLPYVLPLMAAARALARTLAGSPTEVDYGVFPVTVKLPSVPVVTYPFKATSGDTWTVRRSGLSALAECRSRSGALVGLALTGDDARDKTRFASGLPRLLPEPFTLPGGNSTPSVLLRRPRTIGEKIAAWWHGY